MEEIEMEERVRVSPLAIQSIQERQERLYEAPPLGALELRSAIADKFRLPVDTVAVGNGSTELMEVVARIQRQSGGRIIASSPSFPLYEHLIKLYGFQGDLIPLSGYDHDLNAIVKAVRENTRIIFLDTPANVTGCAIDDALFLEFLGKLPPSVIVVYDNVYGEYQDRSSDGFIHDLIEGSSASVIVCRSFSKAHCLFGLRVGYALGRADLVQAVNQHLMPFHLGSLAQCAAIASLGDEQNLTRNVALNTKARTLFSQALDRLHLPYVSTQSNALLFNVGDEAETVEAFLTKRGVRVRGPKKCGISGHLQAFLIDPVSVKPVIESLEAFVRR